MWGGRFLASPAAIMEEINASIDFDKRLWRHDILASKAHAAMLAASGIITKKEGQEIAARNHYRPTSEKIAKKYAADFPKVNLFTIDGVFGGWAKAQKEHFSDGGSFDQIYQPGRK